MIYVISIYYIYRYFKILMKYSIMKGLWIVIDEIWIKVPIITSDSEAFKTISHPTCSTRENFLHKTEKNKTLLNPEMKHG